MKIEIKNRWNGSIIFSIEAKSLKVALEIAVKKKTDLSSADLSSADLSSADLRSADLSSADLRYANLRSADLSSADLRSANLRSADLRSADLSSADLRSADLRSADLSYADLRSADLSSADLRYANLRSADLRSADLRSANLRSADLRSTDLSYANLSSADLSSADLSSADLRSADLSSADLSSADLRSADLRSADLSSADLSYANLSYAKGLNKYRCTPLEILKEQTGNIRAYKLVNKKSEGPFKGGIVYEMGKTARVDDIDEDESKQCAVGINLATLDWCMNEWQEGYQILIAEFPRWISKDGEKKINNLVIPRATNGKFRVRECTIVGEKDLVEIGLVKAEA